jgi:hypothetical protein
MADRVVACTDGTHSRRRMSASPTVLYAHDKGTPTSTCGEDAAEEITSIGTSVPGRSVFLKKKQNLLHPFN